MIWEDSQELAGGSAQGQATKEVAFCHIAPAPLPSPRTSLKSPPALPRAALGSEHHQGGFPQRRLALWKTSSG